MGEAEEPSLDDAIAANKPKRGRPPKPKDLLTVLAEDPQILEDVKVLFKTPAYVPYGSYIASLYALGYGFIGIEARIVHEKDGFQVLYGTEAAIQHIPFAGSDAGAITWVYAVATYPNGFRQFECLPGPAMADKINTSSGEPVEAQLCKFAVATLLNRLPRIQGS